MASNQNIWSMRLRNADKLYGGWAGRFKCNTLEDYYEGFQWKQKRDSLSSAAKPYVINLFYSTIKEKLAGFLFQRPSFILTPTPGTSKWDIDFAARSASLKQDVLNTIVHNPSMNFVKNLKLAALDSFFRFGIIEVGYAADWRNPQKEEPLLKSWENPDISEVKDKVVDDNEVPINERFYIKRIPAKRFRVSVSEATELEDHEWCAYYEFFYTNALRKTKGIRWPGDLRNDYISSDYSGIAIDNSNSTESSTEFLQLIGRGTVSKVWHIFDLVSHTRYLYLDNHFEAPLWEDNMERLAIKDIRWDLRLEGFYPIPPCFQWLSPQDEINEAREQMRSFRRRFTRKWQAVEGTIDPEEKEKFAAGPDGIIITVKKENAITPVQNPEIGATAEHALVIARDDFQTIVGTASVKQADRETATKSKILDIRSQIRESADQIDFSTFVCHIGREILCQAQEKLVEGLWVQYTSDASEQALQDMQADGPVYKWITAQEISDGYDFTIEIDVQNATPAAMQGAQEAFITFLSVLIKFPMIAMSPILIREAAYRCNYRNEKVIQQLQQVAIASMVAKVAGGAGEGAGNEGTNAADAKVAQTATPTVEQVDTQLDQQLLQ